MQFPDAGKRIDALRDRLALRTFTCAALAKRMNTAAFVEKAALTLRWEETLNEVRVLQLAVDLLERLKVDDAGFLRRAEELGEAENAA
jgi:hypothetical protein